MSVGFRACQTKAHLLISQSSRRSFCSGMQVAVYGQVFRAWLFKSKRAHCRSHIGCPIFSLMARRRMTFFGLKR